MSFASLGLLPESLRAIAEQGYTDPTPVQAQAIPVILEGRDLLAGAQTGTGKTAAFVLPMLERLHARPGPGGRYVRALIVVPTRELALQVEQSVRTYGAGRPVRSTAIYGGVRMDRQVRALRDGVEVVVATPGRLLDHVRQRTVDLGRVEVLVLDEADRMLDMGFIPDIRRILERLPADRQSLLFSATFSPRIRRLAEDLLRDPVSIDASPRNATPAPIREIVHPVDKGQKRRLLSHLVRSHRDDQMLVFTRTKHGANRLAEDLGKDGISATAIHGNKSQAQRVRALGAFKQGRTQVLVATDIAARGLDIDSLPHVVNFELPSVPEDYVHRIGRTGRAGQAGTAISLVSADEHELVLGIEKLLKRSLDRQVIEGFEPSVVLGTAPPPVVGARRHAGRGGNGHRPGKSDPRHRGGGRGDVGRATPSGRSTEGWVGRRAPRGQPASDHVPLMPGERIAARRGPKPGDRHGTTTGDRRAGGRPGDAGGPAKGHRGRPSRQAWR